MKTIYTVEQIAEEADDLRSSPFPSEKLIQQTVEDLRQHTPDYVNIGNVYCLEDSDDSDDAHTFDEEKYMTDTLKDPDVEVYETSYGYLDFTFDFDI